VSWTMMLPCAASSQQMDTIRRGLNILVQNPPPSVYPMQSRPSLISLVQGVYTIQPHVKSCQSKAWNKTLHAHAEPITQTKDVDQWLKLSLLKLTDLGCRAQWTCAGTGPALSERVPHRSSAAAGLSPGSYEPGRQSNSGAQTDKELYVHEHVHTFQYSGTINNGWQRLSRY